MTKILFIFFTIILINSSAQPLMSAPINPTDVGFKFLSISTGGTGCKGQNKIDFSNSKASFTVKYESFITQLYPTQKEAAKVCSVNTSFTINDGWQIGLLKIRNRGFYNLGDNVTGEIRHQVFYQGKLGSNAPIGTLKFPLATSAPKKTTTLETASMRTFSRSSSVNPTGMILQNSSSISDILPIKVLSLTEASDGITDFDVEISDKIPWSPCHQNLGFVFSTRLTLNEAKAGIEHASSALGMTQSDGSLSNFQEYQFIVRECE